MRSKKPVLLLLTVLGVFFLFSPAVSAYEGDDCGCADVTGSEKNKLVADMLKSDAFKKLKKDLKSEGYHWNGVNEAEVDYSGAEKANLIAIPFLTQDRTEKHHFLYVYGEFYDSHTMEAVKFPLK